MKFKIEFEITTPKTFSRGDVITAEAVETLIKDAVLCPEVTRKLGKCTSSNLKVKQV